MESRLHLTVAVKAMETQLLLRQGRRERLKAVLPPACVLPRDACSQLLQALAVSFGTPLSVALLADSHGAFQELGLCNRYGVGDHTLHYRVEVVEPGDRPALRLSGVGNFERLRTVTRGVGL